MLSSCVSDQLRAPPLIETNYWRRRKFRNTEHVDLHGPDWRGAHFGRLSSTYVPGRIITRVKQKPENQTRLPIFSRRFSTLIFENAAQKCCHVINSACIRDATPSSCTSGKQKFLSVVYPPPRPPSLLRSICNEIE